MTPPPLTPEQRAIVEAVSGPVRILAGAGTGKTTTISHRIANQVRTGTFHPEQILAVTFTRNSATWLRDHLARQGAAGVQADTFHAAALRIVRRWWPEWRGTDFPRTVESKLPHLGATPPNVDRRALASDIEWLKRHRATPETAEALLSFTSRETSTAPADLGRHLATYESRKERAGLLDFEDMMGLCIALLEEHPPAAEWFAETFRAFTVDEFQDVDPLQFSLLRAWVGAAEDVCVVGDPYQAIYGFKGSSSSYLDEFARWRPGAQTFPLTTNFRSTVEVLVPANAFAKTLPGRHRSLVGTRSGHAPAIAGFAAAAREDEDIVRRIRMLRGQGVPLEEIAILYRLNSQSARYEEALTRAGIPHQVADGDFLDRYHVRQALRGLADASSVEEALGRVRAAAEQAASAAGGGDATEEALARAQDLATLARLVGRFADAGFAEVGELGGWLRDVQGQQMEGVRLMTYHRAKGLEFEAVFLPEVQQGLIPFSRSVKEGGMDEERRLFYVGLTRAKTYLSVSWTAGWDGQRRSAPSAFVADLSDRPTPKEVELPPRRKTGIGIPEREGGEPLVAITSRLFGRGFTRGGRFSEDGWRVEDDAPSFACPTCGGALAVARKPKILYGVESQLYALLCGACAEILERNDLPSEDQRLLSHWGKTGETERPDRTSRTGAKRERPSEPPEIDPDEGETLRAITEREFGVAFDGPGRFGQSGWTLQGTAPVRCADCGTEYVVARKKFIAKRQGDPYLARYFALLCARCRAVREPRELPKEDQLALQRWNRRMEADSD